MNQIIEKLQQTGNWKEIIRTSCKNNSLKTVLANELTLLKLKFMSSRLSKSYQTLGEKVGAVWIENQLKTYHWLLIAVSALDSIKIADFGEQQWSLFSSIFQYKSRTFLKFEGLRLITERRKKNKNWSEEENALLKKIVQERNGKGYEWNDIARKMFELSHEKFFRTGKHCRERWLNYLDPTKERGSWTTQEDLRLLTSVYSLGKKWSEYAFELNRTQHSVKNRFNSLIKRQRKLTPAIKREQKLILEAKKSLEGKCEEAELAESGSDNSLEDEIESEEQIHIQNEKIVDPTATLIQLQEKQQKLLKVQKVQKVQKQQKQQKRGEQQMAQMNEQSEKNPAIDILKYVKEQQQLKNLVNISEYHPTIYSPYWSYSPGNGTPNNFMSSPSPLSFYMNYSFANCFSRFTSQLHSFTVGSEQKK